MKSSVEKYFDGYVKAEVPKENGKGTKTKYVYIDDYYKFKLDAKALQTFKLEALIIQLVYVIVYFYASFMDTGASHTAYVGVFSLLLLIPILFWLDGLFNLLTSKELMERRKHRFGAERIAHSTTAMIWLSAIQIVGEVLYLIIHRSEIKSLSMELLFMLLAAIEVAILLFYKKELKKLDYEMVPNPLATEQPRARAIMEEQRELKRKREEEERKMRDEDMAKKRGF